MTTIHPDSSVRRPLNDAGLAFPGAERRLVSGIAGAEEIAGYLRSGGYAALEDPAAFIDAVEAAGVRGRGGATFSTAIKLRTVRDSGRDTIVVANGEEGEPASVKDKWLMRNRPHLVIDGLRLAAQAVGASTAYLYLSDAESERVLTNALAELVGTAHIGGLRIEIKRVDPTYVAGEESAAVRAINGGPALPNEKPPRVFEAGVAGLPTLVNNVETLANLALLQRIGVEEYRSVGTADSPGTFLMTLTTPERSGLYEVPFGVSLRDVLNWVGSDVEAFHAVVVGGYFAGLLGVEALDLPLTYDAYAAAGSGLGCGAFVVLAEEECPVGAAAALMTYFDRENAGQCGSCFNGTAAMAGVLEALNRQAVDSSGLDNLRRWSVSLPGRGACKTLDGAAAIATTLLREFPAVVQAHLEHQCPLCAVAQVPTYPPYAVTLGELEEEF